MNLEKGHETTTGVSGELDRQSADWIVSCRET